jgi:ABC-type transporter Mla subunit MlaD
MNKKDRKELEKALSLLNQALHIVESARDNEEDKLENLTEGLQQSQMGEDIQSAIDNLELVVESISSATEELDLVIKIKS